jgi:uncharacterized membrane protein (DUF4010 family)
MGYAEIYRRRMRTSRRVMRALVFVVIVGFLIYFSIRLLISQSGLMVGGTTTQSGAPIKK